MFGAHYGMGSAIGTDAIMEKGAFLNAIFPGS
jgi:hypothetical protein